MSAREPPSGLPGRPASVGASSFSHVLRMAFSHTSRPIWQQSYRSKQTQSLILRWPWPEPSPPCPPRSRSQPEDTAETESGDVTSLLRALPWLPPPSGDSASLGAAYRAFVICPRHTHTDPHPDTRPLLTPSAGSWPPGLMSASCPPSETAAPSPAPGTPCILLIILFTVSFSSARIETP